MNFMSFTSASCLRISLPAFLAGITLHSFRTSAGISTGFVTTWKQWEFFNKSYKKVQTYYGLILSLTSIKQFRKNADQIGDVN